jgi:4-aminobutyrate aminotransferase / (S)-3-amino-2-methylpropionate transaminase / 5-aminovalerate transaminase
MNRNDEIHRRRSAAVPKGVASALAIYCARAENGELWDVEGRRYVDFSSGIAVLNTGHRHPRVVAAVEEQLKAFTHTCFTVTPYESYVELAERINALVPIAGAKKTCFFSTGAEAVENAVKIARAHTKRPAVIATGGGFHGRTFMAMALTGKVAPYKQGFGPLPGDVYHVPFPVAYHGVSVADSLAAIEELFHADLEPARVAAIIVEPVQGEGGFYIAPPEYLKAIRALCDQHGIVFIADEVQSGFGRTGRWFAMEHSGVEPDLVTMAKSLAGGFPLSGVSGKAAIMDAPGPGGLGGTYAGSPIACAAALAVLDAIAAEGLLERATRQGAQLKAGLEAMKSRNGLKMIGEIRGIGAMVAMELVENGDAGKPDAALTKAITQAAAREGLVLLSCGVRGNVIRFLAPLTAGEALIEEGLKLLERAILASIAPLARAASG